MLLSRRVLNPLLWKGKFAMLHPSSSVVIAGRPKDTANYEKALRYMGVSYFTTLNAEKAALADYLLLPGGGDITPAFFGQENHGSRNIDTELDIMQLRILEEFVAQKKPVLGICKGLQIINIHFGGTIKQDIETADSHKWVGYDQTHFVYHCGLKRTDFFYQLYGSSTLVNSAHHQAVDTLGAPLLPVCRAGDTVIEGIMHTSLPIIAVQWHPERLMDRGGSLLFYHFLNNCSS